jgi:hypothetical protein
LISKQAKLFVQVQQGVGFVQQQQPRNLLRKPVYLVGPE